MTSVVEAPEFDDEVAASRTERPTQRFPVAMVAFAVAVSIGLRARFLFTPLTADEGGYMAVARAWASGKHLYTDAWVDRPQGLLVLFRAWDLLTGGSPVAIRAMAILFGAVGVVALSYVAYVIAGSQAAAATGLLFAVASSNARIEGFIANGELLAGTVSAVGVALASVYLFRGRGITWLYAGGVVAGCAVSVKQSGFDGFAAVLVCIVAGGFTRERRWREIGREVAVYVAGLVTVLTLLVLHALMVGISAWWYAVVGYRLSGPNAAGADWHKFGITARLARPALLPLLALGLLGVVAWLVRDRHFRRATVLIPAWIVFAASAVVAGGLFHRHYWVTLTFPLALAGGVAIGRFRAWVAIPLVLLAVMPSFVGTVRIIRLDRLHVATQADDDPRLHVDEKVARWYDDHRTAGSTLYVLCASAAVYAHADAIPPYPYLWQDGAQHARDAQQKMEALFAGADPPTFVAQYQRPLTCNPSGVVNSALRQRYRRVTNVAGAVMWVLRAAQPDAAGFGSNMPMRRA